MRPALIALALLAFAIATPMTGDTKLKAVGDNGTVAFLTNGETFEVRVENRQKVAAWPRGETVRVYRATTDRVHPFRLVLHPDRDDADIVSAIKLVPEQLSGGSTRFSVTGN